MDERNTARIAQGKALTTVLACLLEKLVDAFAEGGDIDTQEEFFKPFDAVRRPEISLEAYLQNILEKTGCSVECLVQALIYVDRLIAKTDFIVTALNVHRLSIASVMVAAKSNDDEHYNNAWFAEVGGMSLREINNLERTLLYALNFDVVVEEEEFNDYKSDLSKHRNCSKCRCAPAMLARFSETGCDDRESSVSDFVRPGDHRDKGLELLTSADLLGNRSNVMEGGFYGENAAYLCSTRQHLPRQQHQDREAFLGAHSSSALTSEVASNGSYFGDMGGGAKGVLTNDHRENLASVLGCDWSNGFGHGGRNNGNTGEGSRLDLLSGCWHGPCPLSSIGGGGAGGVPDFARDSESSGVGHQRQTVYPGFLGATASTRGAQGTGTGWSLDAARDIWSK